MLLCAVGGDKGAPGAAIRTLGWASRGGVGLRLRAAISPVSGCWASRYGIFELLDLMCEKCGSRRSVEG
jgi:hypothetical protein